MQIILQEDIEKLGNRGDVVTVKPGYARNFLLPHKLAIEATAGNMKALERIVVRLPNWLGDVVLAPGASLAGMVATSAGDPIQAALVVLSPAGCESLDSCPLEREARTDALGTFCFADLAAGKQNLRVEIEGIPSTSKQAWTVELAEGEAKLGFKIVLGEGRSIAGRVVDPAGLGIESAEVELTSSAPEIQTTASVRSRADGSFQFNGLEPGAYNLTAGFRDVYGTPDDRYSLIDAHAANVDAGASSVVLRLRRAAEITGHVRTSSGDAVVSARVAAVDAEGHTVDGEDVDRRGSFRLRVPAEDVVELRVWITTPESLQLGKSPTDGGALPQAVRAGVRGGDQDVVLVVKP
jgi:hypothetical protein